MRKKWRRPLLVQSNIISVISGIPFPLSGKSFTFEQLFGDELFIPHVSRILIGKHVLLFSIHFAKVKVT